MAFLEASKNLTDPEIRYGPGPGRSDAKSYVARFRVPYPGPDWVTDEASAVIDQQPPAFDESDAQQGA